MYHLIIILPLSELSDKLAIYELVDELIGELIGELNWILVCTVGPCKISYI